MTGNKEPADQQGIIPRGCQKIFENIKNNTEEGVTFEVTVSFLELYNEKLKDLLDPKTNKTIKIRESKEKGVYVENALEELVEDYNEIDELITDGTKARVVAATAMNATSSRSHSVLTIHFKKKTVCIFCISFLFVLYLFVYLYTFADKEWYHHPNNCSSEPG